jgi:hypothetical protein
MSSRAPIGALFLVLGSRALAPAAAGEPVAQATRIDRTPPPRIDGRLDDAAWESAGSIHDFVQREPDEGKVASERCEARVLFDHDSLYVAVRAHDREPDRIFARLTRRDADSEGDWVAVEVDPLHDRRSGYRFSLSAAGVQRDEALALDTLADPSWDGVWEGAAARDGDGWSAEIRIPFRSLRIGRTAEWGFNLTRRIGRSGEVDTWSPIPRGADAWVSRFGTLGGLDSLPVSRGVVLAPYTLARLDHGADTDTGDGAAGAGADLLFRPFAGFSGSATVNPDFGQVEQDPSVLNLTVFETRVPERRRFFVEGANELKTPLELFFSRRIGRRPEFIPVPAGETVLESPEATTILGAARLTGTTPSGLRLSLIDAVTAGERALVQPAAGGDPIERPIEPRANWLALRAEQRLRGGSTVGVLGTLLNREGEVPVEALGFDWDLRSADRGYAFAGQAAFSRAPVAGARATGAGLVLDLRKAGGGRLRGGIHLDAFSPGFEIRDMGFLRRADWVQGSVSIGLRSTEPTRRFRERYLDASTWVSRSWSGLALGEGAEVTASAQLANQWWTGGGVSVAGRGLDDLGTRGGPTVIVPRRVDAWAYLATYTGARFSIAPDVRFGADEEGGYGYGFGATLGWNTKGRFDLAVAPSFDRVYDSAQWLESRDDDGDGIPERAIFGALDTWTFALTLRANATFTPRLSLELYLQPFDAAGRYGEIRELARPGSFEFIPAELDYDPDFASRVLQSNVVLRWEYRPGSALFLIWSDSRYSAARPGEFDLGPDLREILRAPRSGVFLVKLSIHLAL